MQPMVHRLGPLRILGAVWCLALASSVFTARAEGLRAGVARIDITPGQPVMLAGYESRKDLSHGVHDPLSARAAALESDGRRIVLVSVDNCGFYNGTAAPLRQAVLDGCGLEPSELFLCAIHTHSAPALTLDPAKGHPNNVQYTKELQEKLVEVVHMALQRLAPAAIGVGSGSSPVGASRRELVEDESGASKTILGRNPWLMMDREVQVLRVAGADRQETIGVVFDYATHSTAMGPHSYLVSGDVHGLAAQFLERYLGLAVVAPCFAGASGNIDPWYRVLPGFNTTNGWVPEAVLMGTLLGEEVAHVVDKIDVLSTNGPIQTAFKTVELPGKPPGQTTPADSSRTTPMNITVGRIGDTAFVGFGGEVFNELGKAVKLNSPFQHTFILTHCNGAAGYVPTRPSYADGGYEVESSPFSPGAGELMVQEAGRMLRELASAGVKAGN